MYVEKIFWADPYLTELAAKVTSAAGGSVTVDRTIAYAFSGGQESDYGTIGGHPILKAEKAGKQIVYTLAATHGFRAGDDVLITIDWERRYKIMKLHFAAEIVLELMYQHYGHPEKIGAHIGEDKARVDFAWPRNIAETFPFLAREVQRLIGGNLAIASEFTDKEQELRHWAIEGFARVPCGGTHLGATGEIGAVALKRNNIGRGKERIEITLA